MNQQIFRYQELARKKHSFEVLPSSKEELEKILGIAEEDMRRILEAEPLSFEEAVLGTLCRYSEITITNNMRERHLLWYGEDWPKKRRMDTRQKGIVPAPIVLSVIAGQGGDMGWLDIFLAKRLSAKFHHPVFVGDTIETLCEITERISHRDAKQEYGYVVIHQDIFNQHGLLAYERDITYAVFKRVD